MNPSTQNDKRAADETADTRIDHVAERAKQSASNAIGGARDKVDTAAERTEESLHRAADAGAQGAHRVADKVGEWRDRGAELASDTRDQAVQATERLRELIRDNPIATVAVALSAGWLVGRLLKSRH